MRKQCCVVALGAALLTAISCSNDPAQQAYLAALRGEEEGMTRREQLALLAQAIELEPRRAWYRETHAIYAIDLHQFDVASADLDTAITLADRPYLRFLRGLVACQRGEFAASLPDFDLAIAGQPENGQFYRGRSLARSHVGRFAEGLKDAQRLKALVPQQGETYYALGVALAGLGRMDEAVRAFDESLRRRPELVYPVLARSAAYRRLGDSLKASADLEEAERATRKWDGCAPCMDPFRY